MTVLVLGGHGMAGHIITEYLRLQGTDDIWCTVREAEGEDPRALQLDVMDEQRLTDVLLQVKPRVVINAVGLLNEDADHRQVNAIYVNSLLPHMLAQLGDIHGFQLIHISTDCVFSGRRGDYTEQDEADGKTVYARTKFLGEIHQAPHLTIRTSIIGPELKKDGIGLFHWFMQQEGDIRGYERVYWSGVTTLELAKAILWLMERDLSGLVHLTSPRKISKLKLLALFKETFNRDNISIHAYDALSSDKSLINTRQDFTYQVPSYREMLLEMRVWMSLYADTYSMYLQN